MARERELKLAVGDTFVVPDLANEIDGVTEFRELPALDLTSTYHDTADLRLARHGVTLRHRTGQGDGLPWTLKLPIAGRDASEREELSFPGDPGVIPPLVGELVLALARRAPLAPAATLRTHRRRWVIVDATDSELAELSLDEVSVADGDRVITRFRELEIESRGPELDGFAPIVQRLRRAGATLAEPIPKAIRVLGPRATAAPDLVMPDFGPRQPAAAAVRSAMVSGVRRLITHDPFVRLGDVEAVHQMRVASRRLRSDLRSFGSLLDRQWADALSGELRWLGDLLGAVRDADVQIDAVSAQAADLRPGIDPLLEALRERRDAGRGPLLEALRDARYLDLLDRLVTAAQSPLLSAGGDRPAREALVPLVDRAARDVLRAAEALVAPTVPDEAYHALRIRAKRLRYAAEMAAPFLGKRMADAISLAEDAAAVQEILGRHQDAVVLTAEIERVVGEDAHNAPLALAAGRLLERQHEIRRMAAVSAGAKARALTQRAKRWRNGG